MRPIHSSNLLLRFYVCDGWTKEELDKYCIKGSVSIKHPKDQEPYFTLDTGSYFDCIKLLEACSVLHRAFNDRPHESDLQFMEAHQ